MSYNTRRTGSGSNYAATGTPNQAARRPIVTNNFVPGGQLNQAGQQGYTQQQQQAQTQQQQTYQQQQAYRQTTQPQQAQKNLAQNAQQHVTQQKQAVAQSAPENPKIIFKNDAADKGQQQEAMVVDDNGEPKKKPFWVKNTGKVSKKERMRRRNKKLVKILQPKNAVMVLNEMVGTATYTLSENNELSPYSNDFKSFKASVLVDGIEHYGIGKTKMAAKAAAAECAIKYLVFKKLKSSGQTAESVIAQTENGGDVKMEEGGEEPQVLPWQHVASFALHKLFLNWDDSGSITERLTSGASTVDGSAPPPEKKPAKKMPDNPETVNPVMLLNQMMPNAVYEEVSKSGVPPNVIFTYSCSANDKKFYGSGSNKKLAKKMCAFEACRQLLSINYPADVYNPQDSNTSDVKMG